MEDFLILDGTDRSGKSTIAKKLKAQGYEIVHFSAPDKKYFQEGYLGPTYLEDQVELINSYIGKKVVFDRTPHIGELVWPKIYNRPQAISDEDIEYVHELLLSMGAQFIIMDDPDKKAHWQRCVSNKEPLIKEQFEMAKTLFLQVASHFDIPVKSLPQVLEMLGEKDDPKKEEAKTIEQTITKPKPAVDVKTPLGRLNYANAINKVLSKRIIKGNDPALDFLEEEIRDFLEDKIATLLGDASSSSYLSSDEVQILKQFCKQLISKANK